MCLATPARITKITGKTATADFGGIERSIDISMLSNCRKGDYVLVHVGFAIQKIKKKEAMESHRLLAELTGGKK